MIIRTGQFLVNYFHMKGFFVLLVLYSQEVGCSLIAASGVSQLVRYVEETCPTPASFSCLLSLSLVSINSLLALFPSLISESNFSFVIINCLVVLDSLLHLQICNSSLSFVSFMESEHFVEEVVVNLPNSSVLIFFALKP